MKLFRTFKWKVGAISLRWERHFWPKTKKNIRFVHEYLLIRSGKWLVPTSTDKKTISKPGLEESVVVSFVNENVAAENQFDVPGVVQEHHQSGANPQFYHTLLVVGHALGDEVLEDIC